MPTMVTSKTTATLPRLVQGMCVAGLVLVLCAKGGWVDSVAYQTVGKFEGDPIHRLHQRNLLCGANKPWHARSGVREDVCVCVCVCVCVFRVGSSGQ